MRSKAGAAILAILFAVGFGIGGAFGIAMFAKQVTGWWNAKDWVPVPARVIEVELKESHDDSTTYETVVRYGYEFKGRTYEGSRVGFTRGSDNIGSWQQDHYRALEEAQRTGSSVTVWVDAAAPDQSIVDRNLRWSTVAFSIPFAVLFPLISVGGFWVFIRCLRSPAGERQDGAFAVERSAPIRSDGRRKLFGLWCFALFWGLIAFPISFIVGSQQPSGWIFILVLVFPLVGLALLWVAMRATFMFAKHGDAAITLVPANPRVGESFSVQTKLHPKAPQGEYLFTLLCEHVDDSGEDSRTTVRWQQEHAVYIAADSATISFRIPAHAAPTQKNGRQSDQWRITMRYPQSSDLRSFAMDVSA